MRDNEYSTPEHALAYLALADKIPHRTEGEGVLLTFVPRDAQRILDLGTGDGRLISLLALHCPQARFIGVDFSPTMIEAAQRKFAGNPRVEILAHNLYDTLLDWEPFDVIVSSFAIHHCSDARKLELYAEIFDRLKPGGLFCNLEHVASPTDRLHTRFLDAMGITRNEEDPSNILLDVETQLQWLREIGFDDVDCYWKWLELCLFGGTRRT